jgi:outer membrane autotransporter protein
MNLTHGRIISAAMLVLSTAGSVASAADPAFVYRDSDSLTISVSTNLAAHLTSAGYAPTVSVDSGGLPALTGFKQVWDVRYLVALTGGDQASYLGYLQGGGTLFLMGENAGFATRNNTVLSFISAAGGGTLTFVSPNNNQTVQGSFATTPNSVPTVSYLGAGGFTNAGNGTCITKDGSNQCTAIAFGVGTLANASSGALISVLDVNFLDGTAGATFSAFIDNLIAYLAAQSAIAAGGPASGFVSVSNEITHGVATTLDQIAVAPTIDIQMAEAIGSLNSLSPEQRAVALNRLTPVANNALAKLGSASLDAGLSTVAGRLEAIRNSDDLSWAAPSSEKMILAAAGPMSGLLDQKELRHSVWGKIFGADTRQDAMDGFAGYKASTWGLTFGADTRLTEATLVGGALTYASTNLDQRDFLSGSGNDLDSYQATGYASQDFGAWYLEGMLAYGQQRYKSHRDTMISGVAAANYDGDMWAARIVAGLPLPFGEKMVVTPFASLEYNRMTQDGYQESGAGALDLRVDSNSAERVRSGLGVRLAGETDIGHSTVRPSIHIQWLHDFKNDGIATTANFTGGGAAFTTPGQKIADDSGNIGGSLLFVVAKNTAVSVNYDYEGSSGFRSQTGQLIAQMWF